MCDTCCKATGLVSASPESQPSSSDLELNEHTFLKSQPTLLVRDVIRIPLVTFSIWGFYCDISEWHVRSARMFAPNQPMR